MATPFRTRAAPALVWSSVVCLLVTGPLAIIGERGPTTVDLGQWQVAAFVPGYLISGWWLTARRPRLAIGWLFLAAGVTSAIAGVAGAYAEASYVRDWPGTAAALWVFSWMWQPQSTLLAIAFVVFPDGHTRRRWHRWTVWFLGIACGLSMLVSFVRPGVIVGTPDHLEGTFPGVDNPLGIAAVAGVAEPAANLLLAISFVAFLLPIVITGIGWRRSADIRRRQYRWATLLQIAGVVATVLIVGVPGNLGTFLILVQTLAIQLLVVIAILRWRAFDVEIVIRRSLLAGSVLVVGLVVYGVVVAVVSAIIGREGDTAALAGAGAAVLTIAPAALIAQRVVDRGFYGRREDPYAVIAELGRRASAASAPGEALDEIVQAITTELKLPSAAILDDDGVLLAECGTPTSPGAWTELQLEHQGSQVGTLRVGLRKGEDELSPAEERLLTALSHQVGASVRALQLVDGLKAAREHLVVAREEERRRIQRDLHDGLGPQLTAVTMHLDAARNHLAAGNPDDTADLLRDARRELHQAGGDVRRLVYSLGDPSVASRGLSSAIEDQVRLLTQASSVDAELDLAPLPPLSAATEEAIHRIVSEAVTNVVRHARATRCRVSLWSYDGKVLGCISDDGIGVASGAHPGVGTRSQRERADELGGTVMVRPRPGGGTEVLISIPVGPS